MSSTVLRHVADAGPRCGTSGGARPACRVMPAQAQVDLLGSVDAAVAQPGRQRDDR